MTFGASDCTYQLSPGLFTRGLKHQACFLWWWGYPIYPQQQVGILPNSGEDCCSPLVLISLPYGILSCWFEVGEEHPAARVPGYLLPLLLSLCFDSLPVGATIPCLPRLMGLWSGRGCNSSGWGSWG